MTWGHFLQSNALIKNDLFFLFLIANTILFKGNLEGARSLDRLALLA